MNLKDISAASAGTGWLKLSLLALFFWGLWGFLTKLAGTRVHWQTMMLLLAFGTIIFGLSSKPPKPAFDIYHIYGLISGLACALGYLFFYRAMEKGDASNVLPVTALYVAVSSVLAIVILSEPITIKKILGIILAIAAVILLAG